MQGSFYQNPEVNLVKECDSKAAEIRLTIDNRTGNTNIRYYRDMAILKNKQVTRSTNEMIKAIDAMKEERRYLKENFPGKNDLINKMERVDLKRARMTPSAMKCCHRMNHCRESDSCISKLK